MEAKKIIRTVNELELLVANSKLKAILDFQKEEGVTNDELRKITSVIIQKRMLEGEIYIRQSLADKLDN